MNYRRAIINRFFDFGQITCEVFLVQIVSIVIFQFLDSRISHGVQWGEEWAPLTTYRNSLLTDSPDERPPPTRKHYARRNKGTYSLHFSYRSSLEAHLLLCAQ